MKKKIFDYYKDFALFRNKIKDKNISVKHFTKKDIDEFNFNEIKENERFVLSLGNVDSINYQFPDVFKNKVDLLITSPSYLYAQEYIRTSKFDLYWLNIIDDKQAVTLSKTEIGHRKKEDFAQILTKLNRFELLQSCLNQLFDVEKERGYNNGKYTNQIITYFDDMYQIIENSKRILKDKGIFAFFVGNPTVLGVKLPCCEIFMDFFRDLKYNILEYGFDQIMSRSLAKKRNNESPDGMEYEHLIIAENNLK